MRYLAAFALALAACSSSTTAPSSAPATLPVTTEATSGRLVDRPPDAGLVDSQGRDVPPPPDVPNGDLDPSVVEDIEVVWLGLSIAVEPTDVADLGGAEDARVAWLVSDLLRFFQTGPVAEALVDSFNQLTGSEVALDGVNSPWKAVTDLLIAWDLPAPPGYADYKRRLYTLVEPRWEPFFADADADIDWRFVSWGGVRADNRSLGDQNPCPLGCIPALDDPSVTDAAGGDWYPDDAVVFAVMLNGEARAYPKNIMEVHEMVNDTLGGRRIGMPYCTLCGSAQAYLTDALPDGVDTLVLRTSGLLSRSNKVMYDLENLSMFDTFLGVALTGPLREAGVVLEPVTVVTTTWGAWKAEHPETTIVAEDGGIGRTYALDPLGGRDDDGPIFPVGDVDPRLPVQEQVLGVITPDGSAVAFPAAAARAELEAGRPISIAGVELLLDGGGLRAVAADGTDLATHQAFWFAWSQFRSDTLVWEP